MTVTNKLRVAVHDGADALDLVKVEVEGATGLAVEPVFQEVDRSELVVELALPDSGAVAPDHIISAVEASVSELDVLSTWTEAPGPAFPTPIASETVFDAVDDPLPEVARRALRDELPTAEWLPSIRDIGGGDRSYWALAVPLLLPERPAVVGVRRRWGYSLRFSALDAASARVGLSS